MMALWTKYVVELILKSNCCVWLNILWFLISKMQWGWTILKLTTIKISNFDWTVLCLLKTWTPFDFMNVSHCMPKGCSCDIRFGLSRYDKLNLLYCVLVHIYQFTQYYLPKNSHHQKTSDLTESNFFSLLCKFLPYTPNYYRMVFLLKIHGFLDVVLCQLVNSYCCLTVQDTLFGLLDSENGGSSLLWRVDNYWPVDMTETISKQICIIFSTSLRTSNSGVLIH